jgi:DNA (cytosine-5)-methyltransferase 1
MIKAIDFFCGAGGLTRGLLDSGIQVILGIDSNERCRKTYETNNSPAKFLHSDIRDLSIQSLKKKIAGIPRKQLMFAACAPCQPFSKQRTVHRDKRQRTLLGCFSRFIEFFKPEYVFVENVPGIAKVYGNSTYKRFIFTLEKYGYFYEAKDVNAKDYGVPQTRVRRIVLAKKSSPIYIPKPTHGPKGLPYETVRKAIENIPPIKAGEAHPTLANHEAAALFEINLNRLRHTPADGGGRVDWPDDLILKCHKENYKGHSDVYGRMWWERPAPALTCKCYSLSNGRYGHPTQDRAISFREAAALQTFRDDYVFFGISKEDIGNQIGNAVPVRLATIIGYEFLRNSED